MGDNPHRSLHNRPALRDLLEKLVQYAQQQVEEAKPRLQTRYADPELVKEALARASRVLAPSLDIPKEMPTTSKRIH